MVEQLEQTMAAYVTLGNNTLIYLLNVNEANWMVAVSVHYSNECNDGSVPKPNESACQTQ